MTEKDCTRNHLNICGTPDMQMLVAILTYNGYAVSVAADAETVDAHDADASREICYIIDYALPDFGERIEIIDERKWEDFTNFVIKDRKDV
jgi:hypothetical protein